MAKHRFTRVLATALLLTTVLCIAWWAWGHRHHWLASNFRAVELGRIYAGGYQYPIPLRRLVQRYHINTVVSLLRETDGEQAEELWLLAAEGVRFLRVPIPFRVSEEERLARLEEAVALIADPQNQPVLVHCWAGVHRTGAVVAIYRVSHCGWTEQTARAELIRWGGTSRSERWPARSLHEYCARHGVSATDALTSGQADATKAGRF